jgi:hypothetical protein
MHPVDLYDIMHNFLLPRSNFPIKYLGLPLSTRSLKSVDFQPLVDKFASLLTPWEGNHIATAGEGVLL